MKAKWTELHEGKSFLVLSFGHVSAEVVSLGEPPTSGTGPRVPGAGDSNWGILTHPFVAETLVGTLADAQARAEAILRGILSTATAALG